MSQSTARLATLLFSVAVAAAAGCTTDSPTTSAVARAIIDGSTCTTSADCPTGFECEDTGVCQADAPETECPSDCDRAEHDGQAYCDPHGDDSDGTGTEPTGSTCTTAADCAAGLECKTEWTGHGNSVSTCEPHGGGGGGGGSGGGSGSGGGGV